MVSHAVIHFDVNENFIPSKKHSASRIDGLTASIIALSQALAHGPIESVYKRRVLLII